VIAPGMCGTFGDVPTTSLAKAEGALASAAQGLVTRRKIPTWTRADLLHNLADTMKHRADEAARMITLETCMVGRNSFALAVAEVPFVCIKESGTGHEGGAESIFDFLNIKLAHVACLMGGFHDRQ
jgi:acyl-CoA reductase-like NAD-dependent aldehyde dehydrogenase